MTFRHYRPDFAPRTSNSPPGYAGTPLCACSVPCTLRPDGRGRVKTSLSARSGATTAAPAPATTTATVTSDSAPPRHTSSDRTDAQICIKDPAATDDVRDQLFFWVCNAGASNEGKTCGHFRLLDMEKEGRGRWFRRTGGT